jgi:hypothetical protein
MLSLNSLSLKSLMVFQDRQEHVASVFRERGSEVGVGVSVDIVSTAL